MHASVCTCVCVVYITVLLISGNKQLRVLRHGCGNAVRAVFNKV